jgi:hypothetical protein
LGWTKRGPWQAIKALHHFSEVSLWACQNCKPCSQTEFCWEHTWAAVQLLIFLQNKFHVCVCVCVCTWVFLSLSLSLIHDFFFSVSPLVSSFLTWVAEKLGAWRSFYYKIWIKACAWLSVCTKA